MKSTPWPFHCVISLFVSYNYYHDIKIQISKETVMTIILFVDDHEGEADDYIGKIVQFSLPNTIVTPNICNIIIIT